MSAETTANRLLALVGRHTEDDVGDVCEEIGRLEKRLHALRQLRELMSLAAELAPARLDVAERSPAERAWPAPPATEITFDDDTRPSGRTTPEDMDELRRRVVRHIAAHGPRTPATLSRELNIPHSSAYRLVAHRWFEKESDGIHVTAEARNEVMGQTNGVA